MSDKRFDELVEFKDFLDELKKQKRPIPHSEQPEWRETFNASKRKIEAILENIRRTDADIDQMVYELYSLKPEEVNIVEGK